MKKPNFFIIGAPKCGTTSLWYRLNQHPEIYMSDPKEPWYFAFDIREYYKGKFRYLWTFDDFDKYKNLFSSVNNKKIVGEASTVYFFFRSCFRGNL